MAIKTKEKAVTPPVMPEVVTKESMAIVEKKTSNLVAQAEAIVVKTDEDLSKASEFLSNVKTFQKFVKQEKDKRLGPVKETKAWIEGLFSPVEDQIEESETKVKRAMADYHDKKEAENARKLAAIAAKAEAGKLKPETAVRKVEELGEVKTNVKTTAGTSTFSKIKKVRVVDPTKVPDEFWVIDEVTLRAAALTKSKTENRLGEVIPGCEVFEETIVGGRS
jgi:hypothetical protein